MTQERLEYEVDQWHQAQGARQRPDYWPPEATLCEIPQAHELKTEVVKLPKQRVSITVHYCSKCAFNLTEPTVNRKEEKG